jgi:undecaprenyl diphosphate synthase
MTEERDIPQHIAIIMDGNGRWAKEKGLPRIAGHREGTKRVKEIVKAAHQAGIKVLTLFAFSTENWSRPKREVDMLMRYLADFLDREIKELDKKNIRFRAIGRKEPLPEYIIEKIRAAQERTKGNKEMQLVLALNYGARQEIIDAVKKIAGSVKEGGLDIPDIGEENFKDYLFTKDLPDPDLLIRTSGEQRISNFLLWQLSYSELYFLKKYWPDFREEDLKRAIKEYQARQRRFGQIG